MPANRPANVVYVVNINQKQCVQLKQKHSLLLIYLFFLVAVRLQE